MPQKLLCGLATANMTGIITLAMVFHHLSRSQLYTGAERSETDSRSRPGHSMYEVCSRLWRQTPCLVDVVGGCECVVI